MRCFYTMSLFWNHLRQNWKAGLAVSLVSLPLSVALAIASGATPTQGIITGIWAGLIGAIFGGSHYNIIGPTGALSGVLIGYVFVYGFQMLPFVALLSGMLILMAYFFHLDRYIIFIPQSVVHGFTLGVAFIIGLGQLNNAVGFQIEKTDSLIHNVFITFQHISEFHWIVFFLFLGGVLFILLWNKYFKFLPGAIVLAVFGIGLSLLMSRNLIPSLDLQTLGDAYPDIRPILFENIWNNFSWNIFMTKPLWVVSIATAIIAILETLLSGQIANTMTKTKFDRSREVFGLALSNIGSGLLGGIPATAALARTSLNVKSGANHRTAGILNSFFLILIIFVILPYFRWLPMTFVASILVFVALNMVKKSHFIHLIENGKTAFVISLIVAAVTLIEDPIVGIAIGTIIALLIFVNKFSQGHTEILFWKNGVMKESIMKDVFLKRGSIDSDLVIYKISGTLTYINMPAHIQVVEKIKGNKCVIVSLRHAFYADTDGVDYLEELISILKKNNDDVVLSGINSAILKKIQKTHFYKHKVAQKKIFERTSDAIKAVSKI